MSPEGERDSGPVDLPRLAEIFQALRRGRHLADGDLYQALKARPEEYAALFGQLGFALVHHPRDFFYFLDRENFTDLSARLAVFAFVLVEHLADRGDTIEETLMTRRFRLDELPHLTGDRPRQLMAEAGVTSPEDLEQLVRTMERFGFARREDAETFVFRAPAYRFLDLCMEIAAEQDSAAGETAAHDAAAPEAASPSPAARLAAPQEGNDDGEAVS